MKIKSVEIIEQNSAVYDIEVERDNSYICQDVVCHNSPICRALGGQIWNMKKKPVNKPGFRYKRPPAHWQCRSVTVPVTLPYEEMVKEKPELKKLDSGKRATMDGPASKDLTYNDWIKGLSEERQIEILGKTKQKLWKKGKLSMADMVKQNGRALTIKELNTIVNKRERGGGPSGTPVTTTTSTADLKREYDLAKIKVDNIADDTDFQAAFKLNNEYFAAEMRYVASLSKKEVKKRRQNILDRMIVQKDLIPKKYLPKVQQDLYDGTKYFPYDILKELENKGYNYAFYGGKKFRAGFAGHIKKSGIGYINGNPITVYHETAHAIDHMFSGGLGTGVDWATTRFATPEAGKNFQRWYASKKSGEIGKYSNGDGYFDKDDWVDDYEGRIYKGGSVGEEYWTMNLQYFHQYKTLKADTKAFKKFMENQENYVKDTKRLMDAFEGTEDFAYMANNHRIEVERLEAFEKGGIEQYAQQRSGWGRAKIVSPDLTKYIEDNFDKDFWNEY